MTRSRSTDGYAYAGNDPVTNTDPSGTLPVGPNDDSVAYDVAHNVYGDGSTPPPPSAPGNDPEPDNGPGTHTHSDGGGSYTLTPNSYECSRWGGMHHTPPDLH
jgi:hypothetical protein